MPATVGAAVVVCLSTPAMGESEWTWHAPWPPGDDLYGVWGSAPNDIYGVGWGGTMVHCDGSTWSLIPRVNGGTLNAVLGVAANNIFAVGADPSGSAGQILHYDGSTWTVMATATNVLYAIWCSGPNDAYAVGAGGLIMHYNGSAWSSEESPTNLTLRGVWGSGPNDVWGTGDSAVVVHYNGRTWWTTGGWAPTITFRGMWGIPSGEVYFIGEDASDPQAPAGCIYTLSGPLARVYTTNSLLRGIWGTGPTNIYVSGTGGKLFYYHGSGWGPWQLSTTDDLNAIWITSSPTLIIAVGQYGTRARYSNTGWSIISSTVTGGGAECWPAFSGSGPNDVYLVGYPAKILHYDGASWTDVGTFVPSNWLVRSVWANAWNDVWTGGGVAAWDYDGTSWSRHLNLPEFYDIWGSSPNDLWACPSGGNMWHWDGTRWSWIPAPTYIMRGVSGTGPNDVVAVGSGGQIAHWNGIAWSQMTSGTSNTLWDVWCGGPNDVHAVGDAGTLLHYDGTLWSPVSTGTGATLHSLWGSGPNDLFAVGQGLGTALHFDGAQWSHFPIPIAQPNDIASVWGSGPSDIFFAGLHGSILHYGPHILDVDVVNASWGQVSWSPAPGLTSPLRYAPGTAVTLTAMPIGGKVFQDWTLYDPNHPGDFNYAVVDANNPITIVMDTDRQVTATFKCSSGVDQTLPLLVFGLGTLSTVSRRLRRRHLE
jgi:hypothetical protein